MELVLFCLHALTIVQRITGQHLKLAPYGVKGCMKKCYNMIQCTEVYYSAYTCQCTILETLDGSSPISEPVKLHSPQHKWPCPGYPRLSVFLVTRAKTYACVAPYRQNTNKGSNGTVHEKTPDLKVTESKGKVTLGLITLSRTRRFSLLLLDSQKWIDLKFRAAGPVSDIMSCGNRVYWCGKGTDRCGKFEYFPETKAIGNVKTSRVSATLLAVDETEALIFAGGDRYRISVLSLEFVKKTYFLTVSERPQHIAVSPAKSRLYIGFRYSYYVGVYSYKGVLLSFSVKHQIFSMDIDPAGDTLYTTDGRETLTIITSLSQGSPKQKDVKVVSTHNDTRVVAYPSKTCIIDGWVFSFHYKTGKPLERNDHLMLLASKFELSYPVASYMGMNANTDASTREPQKNCNQTPSRSEKAMIVIQFGQTMFRMNTMDLDTGRFTTGEVFMGRILHLDISKSQIYHCMESPSELRLIYIDKRRNQNTKYTNILSGPCLKVAADVPNNVIFFARPQAVMKFSIGADNSSQFRPLHGTLASFLLTLDRLNKFVYMAYQKKRVITRYSYSGKRQGIIRIQEPVRNFVVSDRDGHLYYVIFNDKRVLQCGNVPHTPFKTMFLRIRKTMHLKTIYHLAVIGNFLIVDVEKVLTIFCQSKLLEISKIDLQRHLNKVNESAYQLYPLHHRFL